MKRLLNIWISILLWPGNFMTLLRTLWVSIIESLFVSLTLIIFERIISRILALWNLRIWLEIMNIVLMGTLSQQLFGPFCLWTLFQLLIRMSVRLMSLAYEFGFINFIVSIIILICSIAKVYKLILFLKFNLLHWWFLFFLMTLH